MKTVQFKTNIKCTGCIATVTPGLNRTAGDGNWQVDLQSPDKVLTVSAEDINATEIKKAMEQVGYKAEEMAK
jgi:copper chaperone